MSPRATRAARVYALLLRAYPPSYRAAHEQDMAEVFDDLWTDVRKVGGIGARLRFWAMSLVDLTQSALMAWAGAAAAVLGSPNDPEDPRRRLRGRTTPMQLARDFGQDARLGLRNFRRRPATALSAVAALALGIGGVTAIYSVVHGLMIRPLPYADSERIVRIWVNNQNPQTGDGAPRFAVTPFLYFSFKKDSRTLEDMAAFVINTTTLGGDPDFAPPVPVGSVTWNFFDFLGVRAALGRTFTQSDDPKRPQPDVAVLSDGLWRRSFGADPGVIGNDILIAGTPHRIVGVLPRDFRWYEVLGYDEEPVAWVPRFMPTEEAGAAGQFALGRLRPGATVRAMRAELGSTVARQRAQAPNPGPSAFTRSDPADWITADIYRDALAFVSIRGGEGAVDVRPGILALMGASGFLLLLGAVNVATLLLASTFGRRHELAVRSSIGASRVRIVRQLLTEALVISTVGYVLGVVIAWGALAGLKALAPTGIPRVDELAIDRTVLALSALVSIATGLVFAAIPALRSSRSLGSGLEGPSWSTRPGLRRDRMLSGLVAAQVAASLVILVGAGLMARSFVELWSEDVGFDIDGLWAARVMIPNASPYNTDTGIRYEGTTRTWVLRNAPFKELPGRLVERLKADPRIAEAGSGQGLPLSGGWPGRGGGQFDANFDNVDPDFFQVMHVPLLDGRMFGPEDERSGAPAVAIVNDVLAERFFPGESAVGKRFSKRVFDLHGPEGFSSREVEIVGVVKRIHEIEYGEDPTPSIYYPRAQIEDTIPVFFRLGNITLFLRPAAGSEGSVRDAVVDALKAVAPDVRLDAVRPMDELAEVTLRTPRFYAVLLGAFGVIGALLVMVGVGGVVTHTVGVTRRETGIRIALGARPGAVGLSLIGRIVLLAGVGIAAGSLGASWLSRILASQLYHVQPRDPIAFAGSAAVLLTIVAVAAWLPTRKLARTDPVDALRSE